MNYYLQPEEDGGSPKESSPHLQLGDIYLEESHSIGVESIDRRINNNYNNDPEFVATTATAEVSRDSQHPNFKYLWIIAFLYTLLGPLADLIENLYTVFNFTGEIKNYQVLISFCAFDLVNVLLVELSTVYLESTVGVLVYALFEIAQCVVYANFCGNSRTSLILLIIITIFQVAGKASKEILTSDPEKVAESYGIIRTIIIGSSYMAGMDIIGWIFTLGSTTSVYSQVSFQVLIAAFIWAVKYTVCICSDWSAEKDRQREYKYQPPPIPSLLSNFNPYTNKVVIGLLFTYIAVFFLVALSFGITNIEINQDSNNVDESLCIYGIVVGAVFICLLGVLVLKFIAKADAK